MLTLANTEPFIRIELLSKKLASHTDERTGAVTYTGLNVRVLLFHLRVSRAFRNKKKTYDCSAVENRTVHMKKL